MSMMQPAHEVDLNRVVADNLRAELSRQRWTGRKAATALGLTHNYVSRRLSGETPLAPADIVTFASFHEIPITRLFVGTQEAPTPKGEGLSLPELDSNQQPAG